MSIKSETIKGMKWNVVDRFSVQLIHFALGLITARLLTPADYGVVGMIGIFLAISQTLIDSGFSNALIRKTDRTDTDYCTAFYFNIVVGLVCYAILFVLAPYVAVFFRTDILCPILRVMAINLFLNSLVIVQVARLTIAIDFKTQAKASTASALLSGLLGVAMAYLGYGVWAIVAQSVCGTCVSVLLLWYFSRWTPSLRFSRRSFRDLFSYGSKLVLSGMLHTLYQNMTTLVIGKFYTPKDLGNYSRGAQFPSLVTSNITGVLQRVTFPILAKIQDDDERLIDVYRKYIKLTSMAVFFCSVLLAAVAKPLVLILLADKWTHAIVYLQIFCFALMFDHLSQLNLNLLQVKGRSDLFLRLEIIKKTISFAILIASIPFGVLAICLSKVVYTQIAVAINTYYTGKLFHLGYAAQWRDFSPYLLLSLLACAPAYLLTLVHLNNFVALFLGCALSSLLYVGLIRLKRDALFDEYVLSPVGRRVRAVLRR